MDDVFREPPAGDDIFGWMTGQPEEDEEPLSPTTFRETVEALTARDLERSRSTTPSASSPTSPKTPPATASHGY